MQGVLSPVTSDRTNNLALRSKKGSFCAIDKISSSRGVRYEETEKEDRNEGSVVSAQFFFFFFEILFYSFSSLPALVVVRIMVKLEQGARCSWSV